MHNSSRIYILILKNIFEITLNSYSKTVADLANLLAPRIRYKYMSQVVETTATNQDPLVSNSNRYE